jgi:hypothetical protein
MLASNFEKEGNVPNLGETHIHPISAYNCNLIFLKRNCGVMS